MAVERLIPLLAGTVSAVFAAFVWRQYAARRRPHQLLWGAGLSAYAAASLVEAYVAGAPWTVPLYRAYFVLAAGTVGLLGAGTLHLVAPPRAARAFAAIVACAMALTAIGPLAVPLSPATVVALDGGETTLAEAGTALGGKAVPLANPGRVAFLLLNVVGGLALIVGALWSGWRTRRPGVLLIAAGALMPFVGGSASTLGGLDARILLQFVGVAVMFAGFLHGREASPAREAAPARA